MTAGSRHVLVTPRSLSSSPGAAIATLAAHGIHPVFPPAGEQPTKDLLTALIPGCVGWIAGVEPIDADVLRHASTLKVISRYGSGTSNIDMTAARELGIRVLNAPGANAQGVAELAVALTLDCLRSVSASSQALRESRWERHQGREVAGLSVLVVGFGSIGQRYAAAMAALGAHVTAVDPVASPQPGIPLARDIADAIGQADIVSLHCPMPPDGVPVVGKALLNRVRRGVILINTARAELVDEIELLVALDDGRVGHYAVDAFRVEPPPPSDVLRHAHVLATPHIGAYTVQAAERTLAACVENLIGAIGP